MKIKKLLFSNNQRTALAKKNILLSLLYKGVGTVSGFILVPIILNYLGGELYGIWLTLSAFISWFYFFDFGLEKGLRNRLSEALANNNLKLAESLVSTTYFIISIIVVILFVLFLIVNPFVDWVKIFNTDISLSEELNTAVFIVFVLFLIRFFLNTIIAIAQAKQQPSVKNLNEGFSKLVSILAIYILYHFYSKSLIGLAVAMSIVPIILLLITTFLLFFKYYPEIRPRIKTIKLSYLNSLFGIGVGFFFFNFQQLYCTQQII